MPGDRRIRIREVQKHADPDPQHWFLSSTYIAVPTCELGRKAASSAAVGGVEAAEVVKEAAASRMGNRTWIPPRLFTTSFTS